MIRARALSPVSALVQRQAFGQLLFDGVERVEAGHRLLEDEADVVAADLPQVGLGRADHLRAAIGDGSRNLGTVRQKPHGRQRRDRLARPAFADQRHGLALATLKDTRLTAWIRRPSWRKLTDRFLTSSTLI
jgi:hypothetical protein